MTKEQLKNYLIKEAKWDADEVMNATPYGLVKGYLEWNGIIGYTIDIINVIEAAYNVELEIN